jgi:hypothetical protein
MTVQGTTQLNTPFHQFFSDSHLMSYFVFAVLATTCITAQRLLYDYYCVSVPVQGISSMPETANSDSDSGENSEKDLTGGKEQPEN